MSSLIDHYRQLLPIARLVADEKGTIRAVMQDGETKVHIVRGKTAVLPTQHHLNSENGSDLMFFHPFLEDGGKRVSDPVDDYRSRVATTLGLSVLSLIQHLSIIASSEEHSPPLKTQQVKMMQKLKELDAPTMKHINGVLANIIGTAEDKSYRKSHWPVKIFMGSRGESSREKNTENYSYWTTVTFPLYEEIVAALEADAPKGQRKFAGEAVSAKTLRCLKAVFEYIFSHAHEDNWYSSGSDSDVAPFMLSLLKSMSELTTEINEAVELFINQPGFDDLQLPCEWMDSISAMPTLYREIVAIPVRGQISRVRSENTGNANNLGPATRATQQTQQKPQQVESTVRFARNDSEYIQDDKGRWIRNSAFVNKTALGSLSMLTHRNPYDPMATSLIIPDSGTYVVENTGEGAWGTRSNSTWGRR